MADTIHRTLIIRFGSIGDIILSSLLVRVLRKRFPASSIDFLIKQEYADLIRYNPGISRIVEFPSDGGVAELKSVRAQVHRASYDLLIDIHDSLRSRYLCFGHSRVVRINKRKIARFLLVKAKWNLYDWFGGAPGVAERYLETVSPLGVENDGNGLEVFLPQTAVEHAEKLLEDAGMRSRHVLIGVCPSAKHNNKMWPRERFAETATTLAREHGAVVLLFGSGNDEGARCQEVKVMIEGQPQGIPVLNLAGRLSLLETAAMMDHCSLIVANDSGLMHLAAARKRNVITIFGPTVREFGFFPYGTTSSVIENSSLSCRPCTHIGLAFCPKGHFDCMNDIRSGQVIDAARVLLKSSSDR